MTIAESKYKLLKDIFDKYGERLYKSAYFLLRNREDAEDLFQDVFCELSKSIDTFKGRALLYTWLYRIMLNLYYQRLRKKYKMEQAMFKSQSLTDIGNLTVSHNELEEDEIKHVLQNAINALPSAHKSVIILKYLEGVSYEDMAEILDCPIGTIRSRLYNAKEKLKEKLSHLGGREDDEV